MKRTLMAIAAVLAALPAAAIWACGACDEDTVAATYDHAVVERAMATHHQVLFVAIDGSVSAAELTRRVLNAAMKVRYMVSGTLRTSLSPTTFSFVIGGKMNPYAAVSDFQDALAGRDIRLTLVRVMRQEAMIGSD